MKNEHILVLGATGAMAVYLIPELLNKGCKVVGVSLDDAVSNNENLTYIKADASDIDFLKSLCEQKFDAIFDFMIYNSVEKFRLYYKLFLENTRHYIFFSTYRVYAGDTPITRRRLRLRQTAAPLRQMLRQDRRQQQDPCALRHEARGTDATQGGLKARIRKRNARDGRLQRGGQQTHGRISRPSLRSPMTQGVLPFRSVLVDSHKKSES